MRKSEIKRVYFSQSEDFILDVYEEAGYIDDIMDLEYGVYTDPENNFVVFLLTENKKPIEYWSDIPVSFYEILFPSNINKLLKHPDVEVNRVKVNDFGWVSEWDDLDGSLSDAEFVIGDTNCSTVYGGVEFERLDSLEDLKKLVELIPELYIDVSP